MSYHICFFLKKKGTVNLCFPQKETKKDQIKITKIGKKVMNIVQFSIVLHCCMQSMHLLHFKIKFACICIPKIMFMLSAYQFPKSKCPIF